MTPTQRKRPAFQFYPGDHQRSGRIRSCSLEARGLHLELLCIMHSGEPYGHLGFVPGEPLTTEEIAQLAGTTPKVVKTCLAELLKKNVYSRSGDGVIYSRRMVRDEHLREVRAVAGKAGGDKTAQNLLKQNDEQTGQQTPPPAGADSGLRSSSASQLPATAQAESLRTESPALADDSASLRSEIDRFVDVFWPVIGDVRRDKKRQLDRLIAGESIKNDKGSLVRAHSLERLARKCREVVDGRGRLRNESAAFVVLLRKLDDTADAQEQWAATERAKYAGPLDPAVEQLVTDVAGARTMPRRVANGGVRQ